MANFYEDNPDIRFHMDGLDLERVIRLREDDFAQKDNFPEAPADAEDAVENYKLVLDIVGEIAGDFVAPRAADVDAIGARFENGEVIYAPGTMEALDRMKKSDLMGFTLPREYGGLNMPKTVYSAATEIISRADASLMNIFGLQEIADTIAVFGSKDQKERYLPRFSSGEVMGSMALTEPDAGSDLQAVMLKATPDDDGTWKLDGVKRFITNGCAQISLVMARSEEGTTGGRGVSLFIYERDEHMKIRRIEHKLGINGSPTCELQFNDAPAELLGKRKMGLVKYTMALMNGARLAVAAQAVGIAEAAWREADLYSKNRMQFKKRIREFSAIYELLTDMKTRIEAARTLLYETSKIVDLKEGCEEKAVHRPETARDLRNDIKRFTKYSALLTPMVKAFAAETANSICYDALQVHAGVGYTKEFPVERLYRDARITNIYEGTTQLQVVAAIGGVMNGLASECVNTFENDCPLKDTGEIFETAQRMKGLLEGAIAHVKNRQDKNFQEFHSARLVQTATEVVVSYLLLRDALRSDRKKKIAKLYISKAVHRVKAAYDFIISNDTGVIDFHEDVLTTADSESES